MRTRVRTDLGTDAELLPNHRESDWRRSVSVDRRRFVIIIVDIGVSPWAVHGNGSACSAYIRPVCVRFAPHISCVQVTIRTPGGTVGVAGAVRKEERGSE